MERVDTAGVSLAGFPMAITADNFDQIRVSASIFNLEQQQQRNEFIHLVFKDSNSALGNYDLQWMIIRTDGNVLLQERALVANGNSVNYPDVDCIYDGGNAAIVWTENGFVMYASVNPTGTHLTYHHGHNPVHVTDVGGYEGTRVAISQRDQDTTTCQVDVLYTKNWEIYLSELSLDGRVIQTDTIEAVTLAIAPEIVGIKDDSHISDFYDNTGNFFMVYPGDIALGVGANLYWRSTGFSSRTPHVLYYQDDHDVKDTYVTVDVYGGIHVAYSRTSYDSTEVFYQYFTDSSSLPDPDNFELCVSDQSSPGETDGADSFAPRIETICYYDEDEEEDMIDVYFFWLDEKDKVVEGEGVGNCNIYMRALSFGTDMLNENDLLNPDIQRCDFLSDDPLYSIQAFDTNLQINGIDASADEYNYQFYITWPSTLEIELAELDLENSDSQTITVSSGSQSPTEPSVVSDWFGVAYVVYNLQNQIRMTLVTHNGGSLLLDGTSDVTSVNDVCRNPTIAIDRNTNRIIKKSERYGALPNDYYSDRGKKFLHITFMMETATPNRYIPHYAKYDTDRNRLIAHSILPVASTFNFFGTDLSMFSWMDCDNRLVVGIQGNMDIGANPEWRDTSQFQGIHVMRLDNNGDIIVHESLLSHDGTVISYTSDVSHGNIAVDVHESDTTYCVWTSDKDGDESLYLTYSNIQ
jgi:hypothetical protein